jgi:OOP family OmpA-OmpF porin
MHQRHRVLQLIAESVRPARLVIADGAFPLTKPEDCVSPKKAAKKASKELIACLAPDRRVEVEVSATRTAK